MPENIGILLIPAEPPCPPLPADDDVEPVCLPEPPLPPAPPLLSEL